MTSKQSTGVVNLILRNTAFEIMTLCCDARALLQTLLFHSKYSIHWKINYKCPSRFSNGSDYEMNSAFPGGYIPFYGVYIDILILNPFNYSSQ